MHTNVGLIEYHPKLVYGVFFVAFFFFLFLSFKPWSLATQCSEIEKAAAAEEEKNCVHHHTILLHLDAVKDVKQIFTSFFFDFYSTEHTLDHSQRNEKKIIVKKFIFFFVRTTLEKES